eukprot:CAMPEP_0204579038 /NCGR_PEP_ID=MMETSP0661-20131031/43267_1 /ASSEMBLY_ACC=CAM_ASM_000606 /TAXON_ID=109239 /ORGANISM="Alexandrium margalefi, Strain AMGDE01CS-322" /LENGTH=59 /DNA_ID=CAMNT_0051588011 /DNA_START=11 /DNA_END=186 /DNA_ORIENTATION=-
MKLTMDMAGVACLAESACTFRYTAWALGEEGGALQGRWRGWQGFPNKFRRLAKDATAAL